jgi:hypothetical protein
MRVCKDFSFSSLSNLLDFFRYFNASDMAASA